MCLFIKLGRHVHCDERMNPIDFGGQRSKVNVTIDILYGKKLVNKIEIKPLCASIFIKLSRHLSHSNWMDPIHFGGQRSKVKVTINIYGNKFVNIEETKPLGTSSLNLTDMLATVRGWTLLILEVRGQSSSSQLTCIEISL